MFFKRVLLSLLFLSSISAEDPWGKDAELLFLSCKSRKEASTLSNTLIRFHQRVISPSDGPRSHFFPSSSEYTRQAMAKYGFFQGFLLGCDRLMRENSDPWIYSKVPGKYMPLKYDPVP